MKPAVGRLLNEARFSFAPRGGEDALRQGLIMLACFAAYALSRIAVEGRAAVAMANGVFFMNAEKAMGIFWEPWIQGRVSSVGPLMSLLVWGYGNLHLPVILAVMVWVFTQRRRSWKMVRNWFLAINFMALVVFFLLPTAPPRMILTSGVADINFLHGTRTQIFADGVFANPYAAMPSLHFGYALFVGLVVFSLGRQRWLRWGGFAYPLFVLVAVLATGNHFIVDVVAGGFVVLAAWVFAISLQPGEIPEPAAVTVRERDG